MKRGTPLALASLLAAGCPLGPTVVGTYDSGSGSGTDGEGTGDGDVGDDSVGTADDAGDTASDDGSSSGEPLDCPDELPPTCGFCAPDLDGVGCAEEGDFCSNGVDMACACQNGAWTCSDAPLVDACGPSCVETDGCEKRGCLDDLVVDFDLPPLQGDFGTVDQGIYTVNVMADGEPHSCEFEIDYSAIGLNYLFIHRGCTVEGDGFTSDHPDMRLRGRPNAVQAEVLYEGEVIAQGEVTDIAYDMIEVNGPGCDGVCIRAEVQIPAI